jgi:hypothetical protein
MTDERWIVWSDAAEKTLKRICYLGDSKRTQSRKRHDERKRSEGCQKITAYFKPTSEPPVKPSTESQECIAGFDELQLAVVMESLAPLICRQR